MNDREFVKPPLDDNERRILEELITVADGMGCMKERAALNAAQTIAVHDLSRKGYVTLTKKKFMVVLPP